MPALQMQYTIDITQVPATLDCSATQNALPVPLDAIHAHITIAANTPILKGILGGIPDRILFLFNNSGAAITIDGSSASANRIILPYNGGATTLVWANASIVMFWYDGDAQGWRYL